MINGEGGGWRGAMQWRISVKVSVCVAQQNDNSMLSTGCVRNTQTLSRSVVCRVQNLVSTSVMLEDMEDCVKNEDFAEGLSTRRSHRYRLCAEYTCSTQKLLKL